VPSCDNYIALGYRAQLQNLQLHDPATGVRIARGLTEPLTLWRVLHPEAKGRRYVVEVARS